MNPSVAFVGHLGSGKSTAAGILTRRGYVRHSWAQGVRDIFSMAYDTITPENYADIKSRVYTVNHMLGEAQVTGRVLLQRIGTEAMREAIDKDFWIKAGVKRLTPEPTVNDDTRFLNEAAALRERGFMIVRIVRSGFGGNDDPHPSEVEQDSIQADRTVYNNGSIEGLIQTLYDAIPYFCKQCSHPDGRGFASVHYERQGYWWCGSCNVEEMAGPCR